MTMKMLLCPSMMCADYGNLLEEVNALQSAGADTLHIDIMDGRFVPNFGMGIQDAAFIKGQATVPVDVHLMIEEPGRYIATFAKLSDILYVHPEADYHPARTLQAIADAGCKPGLAINPGTSAETVAPLLHLAEYLLVMTVNPGFAGQNYLEYVDEKLLQLIAWKEKFGFQVVIDGACSPERIHTLSAQGVDGFVLGTSALFGKGRPYGDILQELRTGQIAAYH